MTKTVIAGALDGMCFAKGESLHGDHGMNDFNCTSNTIFSTDLVAQLLCPFLHFQVIGRNTNCIS
jgi:hypothetical protein